MRVRSLGQEDPLGEGMGTQSSILAWRIPWTGSLAGYSPWGCKESDTTVATECCVRTALAPTPALGEPVFPGRGPGFTEQHMPPHVMGSSSGGLCS